MAFPENSSLTQAILEANREERVRKEHRKRETVTLKERQPDDRKLSTYVIFQSDVNNLYLHLDGKNPDMPNALRYAGDYSFGLETRYEVVSHTKDTGLIHILCLRNNKYWSMFEGRDNKWITAMADTPKEEESDKQCTLFRPIYVHANNKRALKLQHVNTGHYVRLFDGSGHLEGCLYLYPKLEDVETCTFIDWESVVMLPDLIRFKGDNGNHLKAFADGYMDYNSKADNSSLFDFEVFPSRDGGIRLRSNYYNTYWTDMDESYWVLLKKLSTTVHETNTVFLPTIVGGNRILMRCLKNGYFCERHIDDVKNSCLATLANYPVDWNYMEIEEPVISSKINNVRYHLLDARLYDEETLALVPDFSRNGTKGPTTSALHLKTTVTNSTNWTNSVTNKLGVEKSFTADVPFIAAGPAFGISAEFVGSKEWGTSKEEETEVGSVKTVTVKPNTRVKGTLIGTRCSYDIPFSYTQRDVLMNGTTKVTVKKDGVFTGKNGYNYKYELVPVPLE